MKKKGKNPVALYRSDLETAKSLVTPMTFDERPSSISSRGGTRSAVTRARVLGP